MEKAKGNRQRDQMSEIRGQSPLKHYVSAGCLELSFEALSLLQLILQYRQEAGARG
jgi:hypothetical protein